ncbi:hypothetical protein Cgig2_033119 [Carnegiea gigantea]|uniref:Reverse transcriptase zinc-binding domain-containing protein n=1 Tax=Carnegiea gigantea TaxID=171969 RepID=A0A9Q1JEI1_9CARY|nr:hypothetical protein Cgig2_033119 [Carnegiea gigantea]
MRQQVVYEWKPINDCIIKIRHEESICMKKTGNRLEWRRKDALPSTTAPNMQHLQQPKGLIEIPWVKRIWARPYILRHVFISSVFIQHSLLSKQRLLRFYWQQDTRCSLCNTEEEEDTHLFYICMYAEGVRTAKDSQQMLIHLKQSKGGSVQKKITSAVITATIYGVWHTRNSKIFASQHISQAQTIQHIKEKV